MTVREAIVVEGRYDRQKLSDVVDSLIVETNGFAVFHDREKLEYLRRLARERGVVLLLDSDGAGFLIRGRLSSLLPKERVLHAYIPDVPGKERRKAAPSKEGLLGVEGMPAHILREALLRAGATVEGVTAPPISREKLTKTDLFSLGLSGGSGSGEKRRALARALGLPQRLSANALLGALNALFDRETFLREAPALLEGSLSGEENAPEDTHYAYGKEDEINAQ